MTGCEVKMAGYLHLYWPCLSLERLCSKNNWRQPSTLNLWNPVFATKDVSMKKQRFSGHPRTKVTDVGATGHRAQPGLGQKKCKNEWGQYSAILNEQAWSINELLHGQEENFYLRDQRRKSKVGKMGSSCPLDILKMLRNKSFDVRARFGAVYSASKTKKYLLKNSTIGSQLLFSFLAHWIYLSRKFELVAPSTW